MSEEEQMGSPLINSRYMLKLEKKILTLTKFFFPSKRVRQNKVLFGSDFHFFRTFKNGPKFNPDKLHHNEGVNVFWKITEVTQLKWKYFFFPQLQDSWQTLQKCTITLDWLAYTYLCKYKDPNTRILQVSEVLWWPPSTSAAEGHLTAGYSQRCLILMVCIQICKRWDEWALRVCPSHCLASKHCALRRPCGNLTSPINYTIKSEAFHHKSALRPFEKHVLSPGSCCGGSWKP